MKKYVDGKYMEMTAEELAQSKAEQRKQELQERARPLTAEEVYRMIVARSVNTLEVDDNTALRMKEYYPVWNPGLVCSENHKVQRNDILWNCLQTHVAQSGWEPENAASLWTEVNETHEGTEDDPIPYNGNMTLEKDKYYVQNWVVYLCIRDTGNPVYHALADLVGVYVDTVQTF